MPGGQPPKYREEYCDLLIEHMSNGDSFETFGVYLRKMRHTPREEKPICRKTLYNWADQFPEFLHAKNFAFDCRLHSDEQSAKGLISGELKGNASVLIHKMKCVEPKLYLEKTVQEVHNKHSIEDVDTSKLSDEELATLNGLITKCTKPNP